MFNRRFLRIKVFQELYAYAQDERPNLSLHEKNLLKSLDKANELYVFILSLPTAFRFFVGKQLDVEQSKYYPSEKIITPLKALYDNQAIIKLEESNYINEKVKGYKLKWMNTDELFKTMWSELKSIPFFEDYGSKPSHSFTDDRKALDEIVQIFIGESELFNSYLEELFINWEDDQVVVTTMLLNSISKMKADGGDEFIVRPDTSSDDIEFMRDLLRHAVLHDEELVKLIAAKTENWEPERIAVADMLIMKMALTEILYFPSIPVKVSINEYLELAKLYSTPNSHGFINGILDKIQLDLRKQNKIVKLGRGLVE